MRSEFEVIPNEGLGNLGFGTDIGTFVDRCGEPEEVQNFEDDEELNTTVLHYWKGGYSAFFVGQSKPILAGVETDHPDTSLFDKKIIGMTEDELVALMKEHNHNNYETDFEDADKRLSYDVGMMDFYFRDNKLVYMNFGVLVDEDGNIETV